MLKYKYSIKLFVFFAICFCFQLKCISQNSLVLNNNVFAKLNNNCYLVVNSTSSNAIITSGLGGNIISENEYNFVKWNISANTGLYVIPFATNSSVKIPLAVNIQNAGTGSNSSILFSTYETTTDLNISYPSDVTNMNSGCGTNNALYATDRFWIVDANSYSSKPNVVIDFAYNDASNEIGVTNLLNENRLKAQRFNSTSNSWETPSKIFGTCNSSLNVVSGATVFPSDFYRSWTLIDTASIKLVSTSTINNVTCNGLNNGNVAVEIVGSINSLNTFTWSNGSNTYSINNLSAGNYTVNIANPANCTLTETFNITEPPTITLSSVTSSASCAQTTNGSLSITIVGGTPQYTINWNNGSVGNQLSNVASGNYTAYVTDQSNCNKQFVLFVDTLSNTNYLCLEMFIPELFTPNADGKNDFFVISKIEAFPNNIVSIYNRWGDLVYQKKSYKNDWDGKPNITSITPTNGVLPSGTYYVVLDFGDGVSKPYTGYVELQY